MTLHLFKQKLEQFQDLISKGKHSKAIEKMNIYLKDGLEEESDAERLMHLARNFDNGVKQAIEELEQGMPQDAVLKIEDLKEDLKQIKIYADLVAKDEEDLE